MSRSAYAVYIIHTLVIVLVAFIIKDIQLNPLIKFMIVVTLGTIFSFSIAHFLVKIPYVKKIL